MVSSPSAGYRPLPQGPDAAEEPETAPHHLSESLVVGTDAEQLEDVPVVLPPEEALDARVRWVYFMLGNAVLLPWNAMITATPYFLARLEGSSLKSTFSSYLSATFTIANCGFLAHATITSKQSSRTVRVRHSTLWLALSLFLLTASTFVHMPPGLFFAFVILNGILQSAAGSYLQASVVAVASLFGPLAMQAVMTGQAVVAVLISAVQLLSASASIHASAVSDGSAEEKSAFAFFGLSTLFLLATVGAHAWLVRLPVYQAVAVPFEQHSKLLVDATHRRERSRSFSGEQLELESTRLSRVFKLNLTYNVAVAYVFVVTLAVFPPITVSITPVNKAIHPLVFSSIHFLVFNCGDYLGRYICGFHRFVIWSARRLLALSVLRTLFIPLFLMCNVTRSAALPPIPPVINSDWLFMLILFLFGLSNGYISSLCMMAAPSLEHNPRLKGRQDDVDTAATITGFSLVGGLAIGSIASFAVRAAVCGGCNPFTE
ncbi:hypothetical protein PUNSTDRAFT_65468 [Punctularia strigosozonata HHB-11173 SS5]|uniref:uncharacterized protein n=1 Tax=Punctularia strigosozonata (strain HHB-11173) TaxID=741275 RepID=UPI0004417696|nr:uncharacterized protein PUNSTDRAFT_65468 [Punctularia strigosozonata HHB-11173 SS5]EIN10375.1 hypothetical protein PUNSTDRAFT_65468 [Punctularia strigosozonata HHB-11173 SS5]